MKTLVLAAALSTPQSLIQGSPEDLPKFPETPIVEVREAVIGDIRQRIMPEINHPEFQRVDKTIPGQKNTIPQRMCRTGRG